MSQVFLGGPHLSLLLRAFGQWLMALVENPHLCSLQISLCYGAGDMPHQVGVSEGVLGGSCSCGNCAVVVLGLWWKLFHHTSLSQLKLLPPTSETCLPAVYMSQRAGFLYLLVNNECLRHSCFHLNALWIIWVMLICSKTTLHHDLKMANTKFALYLRPLFVARRG